MGSAFGGTVGSFVGVAVGITAGQCANVWTVARTVALIAAIYGHDVDDTEVQVRVAHTRAVSTDHWRQSAFHHEVFLCPQPSVHALVFVCSEDGMLACG
jgi:hypothetical protein